MQSFTVYGLYLIDIQKTKIIMCILILNHQDIIKIIYSFVQKFTMNKVAADFCRCCCTATRTKNYSQLNLITDNLLSPRLI